jgi:hypothetical protein
MSSSKIVVLLESEIDRVLETLSEKYGKILIADFHALWVHGERAVMTEEGPRVKVMVEEVVEKKGGKKGAEGARARVVSKKMQEAFVTLATAHGKTPEEASELFEQAKKIYRDMPQADLDAKGGSFDSFSKDFLGIQPEVKEKKTKAKKEKMPSRIDRWTPTLTRTLTKIVEESGGVMTDDVKKTFHAWVDALEQEEFSSCALEGHMRKWVMTLKLVEEVKSAPQGSGGAASGPPEEEEEEDLEEVQFEGETLMLGVKTGKIFRPTSSGDIWVGNAGIGRFASVNKPE